MECQYAIDNARCWLSACSGFLLVAEGMVCSRKRGDDPQGSPRVVTLIKDRPCSAQGKAGKRSSCGASSRFKATQWQICMCLDVLDWLIPIAAH